MRKLYYQKRMTVLLLSVFILVLNMVVVQAGGITPAGQYLASTIDQMDVEHNWLPGVGIEWQDGRDSGGRAMKSHCSAFVAAVANKVNIYILRPPQHSQILLANAQFNWLKDHGVESGWSVVETPVEAQELANQGWLVIVSYKNPERSRPGHIAVVRPSDKSRELISIEGPQIAQAGLKNMNATSVKRGFRNHPDAWISETQYTVNFYAHKIEGAMP